ncbi:hypothetical protein [Zunongwangia atlantica]|uniref:hypothetical protein n=1 Tax=Zunongwangia atlantica TaxID=1502297 RepID=UPI0015945626|nr:hypothetical protein [Zunongwangia atlantica]
MIALIIEAKRIKEDEIPGYAQDDKALNFITKKQDETLKQARLTDGQVQGDIPIS